MKHDRYSDDAISLLRSYQRKKRASNPFEKTRPYDLSASQFYHVSAAAFQAGVRAATYRATHGIIQRRLPVNEWNCFDPCTPCLIAMACFLFLFPACRCVASVENILYARDHGC